jgi:hypothetical protein
VTFEKAKRLPEKTSLSRFYIYLLLPLYTTVRSSIYFILSRAYASDALLGCTWILMAIFLSNYWQVCLTGSQEQTGAEASHAWEGAWRISNQISCWLDWLVCQSVRQSVNLSDSFTGDNRKSPCIIMFYNDLSRGSTSLSPVKLSVNLLDRQTDLSKDDFTCAPQSRVTPGLRSSSTGGKLVIPLDRLL